MDDRLAELNMTQKQFAKLTGLREGTISEFANGKKIMLNKHQLLTIMISLRITDIREIIDIHFSDETKEQFKREREDWIYSGGKVLPEDLERHYVNTFFK